jgi:hypothetical protein
MGVVNCSAERSDETIQTFFVGSSYLERRDDGGGGARLEPRLLLRRRRRSCLSMARSGTVALHAPMAGSSSHPIHNRRHTTHLRPHTQMQGSVIKKGLNYTYAYMIYTSLIDQRLGGKLIYTCAHHDKHCTLLTMVTSIDTHYAQ